MTDVTVISRTAAVDASHRRTQRAREIKIYYFGKIFLALLAAHFCCLLYLQMFVGHFALDGRSHALLDFDARTAFSSR